MLKFSRVLAAPLIQRRVKGGKDQIHRLLLGVIGLSADVGCLIVGLTYLASAAWHALVPIMGAAGADLVLRANYGGIAIVRILIKLRVAR